MLSEVYELTKFCIICVYLCVQLILTFFTKGILHGTIIEVECLLSRSSNLVTFHVRFSEERRILMSWHRIEKVYLCQTNYKIAVSDHLSRVRMTHVMYVSAVTYLYYGILGINP